MTDEQFKKLPLYAQDEILSLRAQIKHLEDIARPIMANITNTPVKRPGTMINYLPEDHTKIQKFLLSPNAWVTVLFDGSFHVLDIFFDIQKESIMICGPGDTYSSVSSMNIIPIGQDKVEINLNR